MKERRETNTPNHKWLIISATVLIPALVTFLYLLPKSEGPAILSNLPLFNAIINGSTFILLIVAWRAIMQGKRDLHRNLMLVCLSLSALFLLSYVTYHATHPSTSFGGTGFIKSIYYFILLTHILLSAIVVPLVLISVSRALNQRFDKHRRIARITLPIWLYVTLTGVLVYILISPYYV